MGRRYPTEKPVSKQMTRRDTPSPKLDYFDFVVIANGGEAEALNVLTKDI